jgi:hypothetical protein
MCFGMGFMDGGVQDRMYMDMLTVFVGQSHGHSVSQLNFSQLFHTSKALAIFKAEIKMKPFVTGRA